jgi:hypothetical protein
VAITSVSGLQNDTSFSVDARFNTTAAGWRTIFTNGLGASGYFVELHDGQPFCYFYAGGGTWVVASNTSLNLANGQNHHIVCTYDQGETAPGIRIYVDDAQVAFIPTTLNIVFDGTPALRIGMYDASGKGAFSGKIDQVRVWSGQLSAQAVHNLYAEQAPSANWSVGHQRWEAADAAEGTWLPGVGQDQNVTGWSPSAKVRLRHALRQMGATPAAESHKTYCSKNSTLNADFAALTATCGDVCYKTDTAKNTGDATTRLLSLDGFSEQAGIFREDTISTTITLAAGAQAELVDTLGFGALANGDVIRCRLHHHDGTTLDTYGVQLSIQMRVEPTGVARILGAKTAGGTR